MAADNQVLLDAQVAENAAALHDVDDPGRDDVDRVAVVDPLAVKIDRSGRDPPVFRADHVRNGLERGRLSGPVPAQKGHALPGRDRESDPFHRQDDVGVDDLDVVQLEHDHLGICSGALQAKGPDPGSDIRARADGSGLTRLPDQARVAAAVTTC